VKTYSVIEADSIDGHKLGEIILVGVVVAVPGNNVKRHVTLETQGKPTHIIYLIII